MTEVIGQNAAERIADAAAEQMRDSIGEVGGREVFFAGRLDARGVVASVRVCARGHEGAVPAFIGGLGTRDVVIHNHPGGDIAPSDADLELAGIFGFHGYGVYIVDNEVTRVYVVVEPLLPREGYRLNIDELVKGIGPSSRLAQVLPQFEVRPQQAAMMGAVAQAFNDNGIAVIEAPTGVGKTIAYLMPAALWSVRNRERVIVSTRTINLQEQIMFKDIPVLAKCLDAKFSAVLVKGRNNYLCWRKLGRALSEATLFEEGDDQETLKTLAQWAEKSADGSLSDLTFVPKRDLWDRVCSEADTCQFSNCPHLKKCFISKARREIAKADLVVTNHHMLFSDLAIKREAGSFSTLAVLPAYRRVIFDEAHSIEDSATEYFGVEATRHGAMTLLGRLVRIERERTETAARRERGLLPYLKLKLMKQEKWGQTPILGDSRPSPKIGVCPHFSATDGLLDFIDNTLLPAVASTREALQTTFDAMRHLTAERCGQIGHDIKWRLTQEVLQDAALREIHTVYVAPAVDEATACAKHLAGLAERVKALPRPSEEVESPFTIEAMEVQAYAARLERMATVLAEVTSEELQPNTVRWIEIDAKKPHIVRLVRSPLHVGQQMAEWVYPNLQTIAMTSATLSVHNSFDYLCSRIGLDRGVPSAPRTVQTLALDSPFDFQEQALLCIPIDIAAPDEKQFLEDAVDHIREALSITRGHALVLFTSFYALDFTHRRLEAELTAAGITPLKQGSAARTLLLDRFRGDASSVLFATDSFWEGVDVAGEALQCVILTKLPFRVPTEPLQEARAEAIERAGGSSFMDYTVPQAVIKFRQGFGRLIRRKTDFGAIVVLDRRVVTKHYGRVFLESLPGVRAVKGPRARVYAALREFIARMRSVAQD